jgi:tetratricopeptide (TPR) repeat protein
MSYYSYGELYYMNEEYDKAYKEFQASIDAKEGNENDSLNYLGCCLIALGKYHEAIKAFDKIIESAPTWERPLFNKGRAMMCNPEDEDVYFYLGKYYEEKNEYKRAKEYYEKSLQINSHQPETHLNLGIILFQQADFNNAI